jgi:hypothetical protein
MSCNIRTTRSYRRPFDFCQPITFWPYSKSSASVYKDMRRGSLRPPTTRIYACLCFLFVSMSLFKWLGYYQMAQMCFDDAYVVSDVCKCANQIRLMCFRKKTDSFYLFSFSLKYPDLIESLGSVYEMMNARTKLFPQLSKLQGKLQLVMSQVSCLYENCYVSCCLSIRMKLRSPHKPSQFKWPK